MSECVHFYASRRVSTQKQLVFRATALVVFSLSMWPEFVEFRYVSRSSSVARVTLHSCSFGAAPSSRGGTSSCALPKKRPKPDIQEQFVLITVPTGHLSVAFNVVFPKEADLPESLARANKSRLVRGTKKIKRTLVMLITGMWRRLETIGKQKAIIVSTARTTLYPFA